MEGTICPKCGMVNPADARFCSKCGTPAPVIATGPSVCPKCGAGSPYDSAFCGKCGAAFPKTEQVGQFNEPHPGAYQQPRLQAPYTQNNKVPHEKKRAPKAALIAVVAIAIIAASVIGVATIMGGFGGTTDTNDYKIGTDRVPSVSYALGESRNVRSLEMDAKGGVETVTVVYDVSGDAQGDDMRAYFEYLTGSGGFEMRDGLGDDAFGGSSGASIQAWRNSKDSGYMVIVQADYDTNGYTITVMRGEGQTAETPGSTEPPESTQPPESAKPPESTQPPESEQPPESSQPPTTDVNLSSGVPATGAPLYVNSAVGFSIIPRENWYAEETESDGIPAVLVTTPKNDRIVIMSMQGYSMADFAADEEGFCQSTAQSMGGDGYTIGRSEKIKFAGYDCHLTGFMVTAQGTAVNYIFNYAFDGGSGKLYSIAYILPATATGAEHEELLDVFSTFKIQ